MVKTGGVNSENWETVDKRYKIRLIDKWYLIFLPIAFGVCRGIQCDTIIDSMIDDGQMYTYGTVIDYIMFAMQGMSVYKFNPTEYFSIPIYWFIFQMGAFYIVAYYAFDDFKKMVGLYLLR